ncbi:DUF86 domain-containing protein [Oceanobacillus massiliensis]|uniref:DUF86 domain-containing protein n=1 Tax=Oceanobacillus massiliensis TaxID=1465765 RepID=UPI0002899E4F|nr:DUF86 domain-containing protein [Oceanobacillus massiliensis]
MYFVDRSKIEQVLSFMKKILNEVKKESSYTEFKDKLSLERMVHVLIESTLDVGNMMIDGFIMRDPGSFEDIIDILVDEKVLPQEEEAAYKSFIGLRKMLINNYTEVDHAVLLDKMNEHLDVLDRFSVHIGLYLDNELEVVNAFSNE